MTTLVRHEAAPASPPAAPLASEGGPKAVTLPYREGWRAGWWRPARKLAGLLRHGVTTSPTAEGLIGEFERSFAAFTGCKHAIAMNSGTATLHCALFAVGVGPGDEVILPSYTWHATASAVLCAAAKPVFCDVNPRTLTADPDDVARRITPRTKAILVVHVWGNPAAMDRLKALANTRGVALVEDCSHAHGATYDGKPVGSWGDVGCFSLQGGKAVSAGEGGVAVCNDRCIYGRMLALGHPVRAGQEMKDVYPDLGNVHLGPKYRPHLFGVVLAAAGLERIHELNRLRRACWSELCEGLANCAEVQPVETLPGAVRGGFLEFKLILDSERIRGGRDAFLKDLQAEGVPATADRYGSLHKLTAFRRGGHLSAQLLEPPTEQDEKPAYLPNTEALANRVVTLPPFTKVSTAYLRQVVAAIRKVAAARVRQS